MTISKKDKWYLLALFVLAYILRLLFYKKILGLNPICGNDSLQYLNIAFNIQTNFANQLFGKFNFLRLPGYPAIIAFFNTVFSSEYFIYIQIFFSALIPVLTYFLSREIFKNDQCAIIAAFLVTINIGFILYSGLILTETFFIFFLVIFFLSFLKAKSKFDYIIAGILLGFTSLIRPIGIFVLPICFLSGLRPRLRRTSIFLKSFLIFLISWLAIISPLLIRNYQLTGHIFMHTLPGDHFLTLSAAQVFAKEKNISHETSKEIVLNQAKQLRPNSEIQDCLNKEKLAKEIFLQYPITTIKIWAYELIKTMCSRYMEIVIKMPRLTQSKIQRFLIPPTDSLPIKLILIYELIYYLLEIFCFIGAIILIIKKRYLNINFIFILSVSAILIILSLASGYARFRLPAEIIVLISCAWFYSLNKS